MKAFAGRGVSDSDSVVDFICTLAARFRKDVFILVVERTFTQICADRGRRAWAGVADRSTFERHMITILTVSTY